MRFVGLGAMLLGAMVSVTAAWGAPGDFDPTFGDHGTVHAPFPTQALGYAIARQPDGKLLAAGVVFPTTGPVKLALVRFLAGGTVDASFGHAGVAGSLHTGARSSSGATGGSSSSRRPSPTTPRYS